MKRAITIQGKRMHKGLRDLIAGEAKPTSGEKRPSTLFEKALESPRHLIPLHVEQHVMNASDFKLRERIKELNCLYKLSKIAWEAKNDLHVIFTKTLQILPAAMQHPELAEASIVTHG